ncbi:hypothetical protein [Paraburkholderia saeva]|uniref:hypothetical protein n=1 Tax=Paraburkholderia saeva TaxID=2777537 RepID=UPI001DE372B0|nr:hypothetical protein [Paraburkholderia saeva]CAG4914949.1 hypothetical protein R52603_04292 [Paraburkholderia saeva]
MNFDDALDERVRHAYDDTFDHYPGTFRGETLAQPGRIVLLLMAAVCLWSLVETPRELSPADGSLRVLALALAKLMLLSTGVVAILGMPRMRSIFVFLCGASVFAIASALPGEYAASKELFCLSLVECALKAATVVAWALWYFEAP